MRPLDRHEILDLETYAKLRPDFLERVIAFKRSRRLPVGDRVTLVFENRETVRFQVQEMLRVERIDDPARVQDELDVYNELVPGEGELSATLLIEITDSASIREELDRLIGLDEHVALVIGERAEERSIRADFDPKQFEQDRIAAVQYVRFHLDAEAIERLRSGTPARVRIDHPRYVAEAELPAALRQSLLEDLEGDPPPLLED